jgi:hypothetical protein
MEEQALTRVDQTAEFMPLMTIEQATDRYKSIVQYVKTLLHEGTDFGKIPGTDKNVLLKPGAEKLCTLFGLTPSYELMNCIEDWTGAATGEAFFYYRYKCTLTRHGAFIADSEASANSHESKYRWRKGERICPECGKATIIKGKAEYGGGWLCWTKKEGCGAKFFDGDEKIEGQNVERIPNPDIADQVNTLQKMSQKRALLSACLLAVNASEFFTVDLEDFADVQQEAKDEVKAQVPKNNGASAARGELFNAIKGAGKTLNSMGDSIEWTLSACNAFANENFNTSGGVDSLSDAQLGELAGLMSNRIDSLKDGKRGKKKGGDAKAEAERVRLITLCKGADDDLLNTLLLEKFEGKAVDELSLDALISLQDQLFPF